MIDLKNLQKEIYQNKVDKGFNVTDINKEFCLTYGEVAEAYEAWRKKKDDLGEELADVAIYLLGLSEILGIDLEDEIQKKIYKNSKREYKVIDGVNTRTKEFDEEMISSGIVREIRNKKGNLRYEYFNPIDDKETILLIDS